MSRQQVTWRVEGMHCVHCEATVERLLSRMTGLYEIRVSFRKGTLTALWDAQALPQERIAALLREEGYTLVGQEEHRPLWREGLRLLLMLAALAGLYWLVSHTVIADWLSAFPVARAGMSLGALFVVGLMTSLHCVSMCGGINLAQSANAVQRGDRPSRANLLYNLGRVISYTLTGGIIGALGTTISVTPAVKAGVQIAAAVFMLIMALNLLGGFSWLRRLSISLPKGLITRILGKSAKHSSFVIGLANGLMPCGPLQSMQLFALSAGSWWMGALSMLFFSLGTTPLMLGVGLLGGRLNQKHARYMHIASALLVMLMGMSMLSGGLALAGVDTAASVPGVNGQAVIQDGVQYVHSDLDYRSYPTITVQAGIPVRWTLTAEEGKLNGCNNEIVIPAYGMSIPLHVGDNVIEFTPEQSGTIPYTCWMGMLPGRIVVVDAFPEGSS